MMNISLNNRPNRVCCRLCLAPENECVSIYMTSAADKEPLSSKINACVRIKVQKDDRLSPKICHACISYLNSWQSFKNRCDAAQKKQRMWMGLMPNSSESTSGGNKPQANILQQRLLQQQQQQHKQNQLASLLSQNRNITLQPIAPKTNLLQQQLQKKSTPPELRPNLMQQQQRQKDGSDPDFIKREPAELDDGEDDPDIDDEKMDDDIIDPTQFLAREDEDYSRDGDEPLGAAEQSGDGENPQILASLGLHSVNSGYGGMSDSESQNGDTSSQQSGNKCIQIPANCTICDMRFSNRANARRHERNIHGVILNPIGNNSSGLNGSVGSLSSSTPKNIQNAPKLISLIKKTKMPVLESAENWDYSSPQKYRSYLTPAKLSFILQNLEFLEQSQDMLCKCCDKQFPSYKFFMGHMRKRYHNLPRNVCFKCLKHFESKGQFIGHLKRKTCLNLYKIVMNDDTITKDLTPDNASKGAKEFLSDKTYACKLCPKQYPYKSELRNHVFELKEHPEYLKNKENDTLDCAYCDKSFEDQTERKRHYNNLDCISFIVCGTCKDQVASNQAFVEHVYSIHLKKNTINGADSLFESVTAGEDDEAENLLDCPDEPISLSKQPQACPVCDKQYNNYYNVLRHMESKHPDQVPRIYECVKCFETFVRQSELKEHVARVHNLALISGKMIPLSNNVRTFICRECGETFNEMLTWLDHQVTHGKFNCNQCEYSCETRDDLEDHLNATHNDDMTPPKLKLKLYSCKHCTNTYSNVDGLRDHMLSEHNIPKDDLDLTQDDDGKSDDLTNFMLNAQQFSRMQAKPTLRCRYCNDKFISKPDLTQHMINEHGTSGQLLSCTLCQAEFVNDKGLKVHLWRSHQLREPDWGGVLPEISRLQTQPIKNKVVTPAKEYECDICHIVYKSRDQLRLHCTSVHGFDSSFMSQDVTMDDEDCIMTENVDLPNVWYQCRYCDQSFNTSNQLISHMDGHDEDQPQDYTCRECNSIFGARKELWAHRHKNHPRSADPSACDMCKRVFFDKTEIYYHNMHAHTQADFLGNCSGGGSSNPVIRESLSQKQKFYGGNNSSGSSSNKNGSGMSSSNRNSSHHGIGNRASSADGNNSSFDPMAQFYDATEQQEYSCDMCPKTFNVLNALQVHRGWHLRGPDGRKVRDPADTWQPDQLPPSKVRKMTGGGRSMPSETSTSVVTTPRVPVCPFCKAKFASGNNLRRHIVEVHKRNDARYAREASGSPSIVVDKPKECSSCNLTFKTIAEWVDHKIQHARTIKPSTTFEWNCEICGKMFTRKERLLQHMITHLNNDFGNNDSNPGGNTNENTEDGDNSSQFENHSSDGSRDGTNADDHHNQNASMQDDDDSQSEAQQEQTQNDSLEQNGFGCELCQVFFKTAKELRKHVTEHFVNGGNSTTNTTQNQTNSQNQSSAASSSDESGSTHESGRSNQQMTAQEHQAFAAISQEYKCRICGSVCQDQLEMMTCMGSHQIPTSLKCSECQLYFANSKQVLDHETLYHPKGYI